MSIQPSPTNLLIPIISSKVKRGLRWGALMGAVVGWLRALAVVDPDALELKAMLFSPCVGLVSLPGCNRGK